MSTDTDLRPSAATPGRTPSWLRRSRSDRMIAGVCGGVAPQLGVDPAVLRLLLVVLTVLGGGLGIVIYLAAWILIPEEDASRR